MNRPQWHAVSFSVRGQHIGEKLVLDCLEKAKEPGFRVLRINAAAESNTHARHLFERLGFVRPGAIPGRIIFTYYISLYIIFFCHNNKPELTKNGIVCEKREENFAPKSNKIELLVQSHPAIIKKIKNGIKNPAGRYGRIQAARYRFSGNRERM